MRLNHLISTTALFAALAIPFAAAAQTAPGPTPAASTAPMAGEHHGHASMMHALRAVNLTDAQKQQIKGFRDQMRQANQNADPATKHANGKKMRDQVMGILTPDQRAQFQAELASERAQAPSAK